MTSSNPKSYVILYRLNDRYRSLVHKETDLLSLGGGEGGGGVAITANIGKFQKQTGSHELSEGRN